MLASLRTTIGWMTPLARIDCARSFRRSLSQARSGAVIVRVTLDVLAGELAVGVLKGDGQTYIDEVLIGVGPQRVADILVADPAAAGA